MATAEEENAAWDAAAAAARRRMAGRDDEGAAAPVYEADRRLAETNRAPPPPPAPPAPIRVSDEDLRRQGIEPRHAPDPEEVTAGTGTRISTEPAPVPPRRVAAQPANPGQEAPSAPATVTTPGGLRPYSLKETVKEGKEVPGETKEAYAAGTALRLSAAEKEHGADRELYEKTRGLRQAELQATSDAATAHADVQARRDAEVRGRLDQIESLNQEVGAEIDPNKFWHDRGALATVIGTISVALGAVGASLSGGPNHAAQIIDGAINRDIQAQLANREGKRSMLGQQMNLLGLHRERLADEDRAIDATKLAYYDNILKQIGMYREENGLAVNDANFQKLTADIMERYGDLRNRMGLQEQSEKTHEFEQKYRAPQTAGGVRKEPGNIITLADGTSYAMPTEKVQNETIDRIETKQAIIRINAEIMQLRRETKELSTIPGTEDYAKYRGNIAVLESLENDKLKAMETAAKQGVLREGEYERAKSSSGHATTGLGMLKGVNPFAAAEYAAGDRVLEEQQARWTEDLHQIPHAAGGHIVERGYQRNPTTRELEPTARYTGQNVAPRPGLPPPGFEAYGAPHPTMNRPDTRTTPSAPEFPYRAQPKPKAKPGKEE